MKYVMVTNFYNHWDNIHNNETSYTIGMIKWNINNNHPVENTETLFIKKHKPTGQVEGCWLGKVSNFKRNNDIRPKIYFNVQIDKKIFCPEEYRNYTVGWYRVEGFEGLGNNVMKISKPVKVKGKEVWINIHDDFGITKLQFGKRINFVKNQFKRRVIFRDVEQAYTLLTLGFYKPAVILSGGVVEELLRLYLEYKNITTDRNKFESYLKSCEEHGFIKSVQKLSGAVKDFRNFVHLEKEVETKDAISQATATTAVASIFTIVNEF